MFSTEISFDVGFTLGIGRMDFDPLPRIGAGRILLRVSHGLSFYTLRESLLGRRLMCELEWLDQFDWYRRPIPRGLYGLQIPVPHSDVRAPEFDFRRLPSGPAVAPVALVAAALLCLRVHGIGDPLQGDWVRCAEVAQSGQPLSVCWLDGRLFVNSLWTGRTHQAVLWMSSVQTLAPGSA